MASKAKVDEFAAKVTERIVSALEAGTAPWQKDWESAFSGLPRNHISGKEYRGFNAVWLLVQGRSDPRWLTYNQAAKMGLQVRKGEKGTQIEFWRFFDEKKVPSATGGVEVVREKRKFPICRFFTVFNGEQIEGMPELASTVHNEWESHAEAERLLVATKADIQHIAGDRAAYSPRLDTIYLPQREQFMSASGYYATALHELGHWTGHPSRLNRDFGKSMASEEYAKEELRAEIFSMVVGQKLGVVRDQANHASYIDHWVGFLKRDPREIFRASRDAFAIQSYVQELAKTSEQESLVESALVGPQPPSALPEAEMSL